MQTYTFTKGLDEVVNIIFNEQERQRIKETRAILIELVEARKPDRWNKLDHEALYEIMLWPLPYADGGTLRDISVDQILKIDKMLKKVAPQEDFNFAALVELTDEGEMTRAEMFNRMEMQRAEKAKYEKQKMEIYIKQKGKK